MTVRDLLLRSLDDIENPTEVDVVLIDRRDSTLVFAQVSPGLVSTPNTGLKARIVANFTDDELDCIGWALRLVVGGGDRADRRLLFLSGNIVSVETAGPGCRRVDHHRGASTRASSKRPSLQQKPCSAVPRCASLRRCSKASTCRSRWGCPTSSTRSPVPATPTLSDGRGDRPRRPVDRGSRYGRSRWMTDMADADPAPDLDSSRELALSRRSGGFRSEGHRRLGARRR